MAFNSLQPGSQGENTLKYECVQKQLQLPVRAVAAIPRLRTHGESYRGDVQSVLKVARHGQRPAGELAPAV